MKISFYQKLLETEATFDVLLNKCQIPITNQDRIHRVYKLISDFDKARNDPATKEEFLRLHGKDGMIEHAIFDLTLFSYIIPYISKVDFRILKKKLKKLLTMSAPSNEDTENNEARNTLFELLFFSYLRFVGISAELRDPNPDIFVQIKNRSYFIQCKRVFSLDDRAVRSNVLEAVKQLDADLKGQGHGSRGILALSVERKFTEGNKKLVVPTEDTARLELNNNLHQLIDSCGSFWQDLTIVKDKRFVAVFLHHMAFTNIKEQTIDATGQCILANNTIYPPTEEWCQFLKDFSPLSKLN